MAPTQSKSQAGAGHNNPAKIAGVVFMYFVISISLVFLNKILLTREGLSIPAPLFVTWFQCLLTVIILYTCGKLGRNAPTGSFWAQFPEFEYNLGVAAKVARLSVIFVGMVTFNNLCLKYVEVSFYNVARSLTIVFNVVLSRVLLGTTTSSSVLGALAVVIAGFYVGSESEVNFSLIGTVFGVCASMFVSLNSIFTKSTLDYVRNDKWLLQGYNNMNAVIMFMPLIFVTEFNIIMQYSQLLLSATFWSAMILAGIFGFGIGIATILQIQFTSPLTHNISGTAKACVQTLLALLIWQNPTNAKNLLGVALVLGGSLLYAYIRNREMKSQDTRTKLSERNGAEESKRFSSVAETIPNSNDESDSRSRLVAQTKA